jgi:hypothetical protein
MQASKNRKAQASTCELFRFVHQWIGVCARLSLIAEVLQRHQI